MTPPTARPLRFPRLMVVAALLVAYGCGDDAGGAGGSPGTVDEDLELMPDARVIDVAVRDRGLIRSDADMGEYVFDSDVLTDAGIEVDTDDVLLIAEQALIRVTSTTTFGDELTVTGEPATLPELVEGRLRWDLPLGGDGAPAPALLIGDHEIQGVRKNGSIDYAAEVSGFNIGLSFTPTSSRNEFEIMVTIQKGVEPAVDFRAVGTGRVSGFRHALDVAMTGGATRGWNFSLRDMDIEMQVEMAGATAGMADLAHVLPKAFVLRIPIPTSLPLGLNIQVSFGFTAALELPALFSASTQASATFRYQGRAGFDWDASLLQPEGVTSGESIEFSDPNTAGTQGPASATVGLVPRFSLNALLDQTSVRLEPRFIVVGNLRGDVLAGLCVEIGVQQSLVGVATASWFGISVGEVQHEFYKKLDTKDVGECSE